MSENVSGIITFTASGAIPADRLVKFSAARTVTLCGSGEVAIGKSCSSAVDGGSVDVRLLNSPGSYELTAAEAISAAAVIYPAANGMVKDTAAGTAIGYAIDAATALNDVIACYIVPVTPA